MQKNIAKNLWKCRVSALNENHNNHIAGYACVCEEMEPPSWNFLLNIWRSNKKIIFPSTYRMFIQEYVVQSSVFFKFKHFFNVINFFKHRIKSGFQFFIDFQLISLMLFQDFVDSC